MFKVGDKVIIKEELVGNYFFDWIKDCAKAKIPVEVTGVDLSRYPKLFEVKDIDGNTALFEEKELMSYVEMHTEIKNTYSNCTKLNDTKTYWGVVEVIYDKENMKTNITDDIISMYLNLEHALIELPKFRNNNIEKDYILKPCEVKVVN